MKLGDDSHLKAGTVLALKVLRSCVCTMETPTKPQETVLLVDDEPLERRSARTVLECKGYNVVDAGDCHWALAKFAEYRERVSAAVVDISLPDGNGFDLAMDLQREKPDLPILFVSGSVGAEFCRFYGLDLNDLHFLRKPFHATELIGRVRRVLAAVTTPLKKLRPSRLRTASGVSS